MSLLKKYEFSVHKEPISPNWGKDQYHYIFSHVNRNGKIHCHDYYELDYIFDGSCTQILNGIATKCEKGTLTVLGYSDFHTYDVNKEQGEYADILSVHVRESCLDTEIMGILESLCGLQFDFADSVTFQWLDTELSELLFEFEGSNVGKELYIKAILTKIILYISRNNKSGQNNSSDCGPEYTYIEKNFRNPITEAEVAACTGYSTSYFSKMFRSRYGMCFQNYILEKRLQYAYKLIASSNMSLTECYLESGFNSYPYFSRRFKEKFGITPRDLRVEQKNKEF